MIETARGYGRGILRGIAKYVRRLHNPWEFYFNPGDFDQMLPKMKEWSGHGIIARIQDEKMAREIQKTGLPVIALDFSQSLKDQGVTFEKFGEVQSDSHAAAVLAAEHFLERQFTRFAFVGNYDQIWSHLRQDFFQKHLGEKGFTVHTYPIPARNKKQLRWELEQANLEQWLQTLPKPIGLLACNDQRGREVLEACQGARINVPYEVAVMGIDNDELLCDLSNPSLTSVAMNTEQGGYQAAELLDQMMQGRNPGKKVIIVQSLRIELRRSTDVAAIDDRDMASVMQYIHQNVGIPISIGEVAKHVSLSKRTLQIHFKNTFGRTINYEIRTAKLNHARKLLQETGLSIPDIAELSGFGTSSYLIQCFRQHFKLTPSKYRQTICEFRSKNGSFSG